MSSRTSEPDYAELAVLYEGIAGSLIAKFNKTQQLDLELFAIELDDEGIRDIERVNPRMVRSMVAAPRGVELLMTLVRCLLTEPEAVTALTAGLPEGFAPDVVVQAAEAWAICVGMGEGDADLSNLPSSLADHPERIEAVVISLHTRGGSFGGVCPITGTGAGRRATYQPLGESIGGPMTMHRHACH